MFCTTFVRSRDLWRAALLLINLTHFGPGTVSCPQARGGQCLSRQLSRTEVHPHEWCLNHRVVRRLVVNWGQTMLNLFASPLPPAQSVAHISSKTPSGKSVMGSVESLRIPTYSAPSQGSGKSGAGTTQSDSDSPW